MVEKTYQKLAAADGKNDELAKQLKAAANNASGDLEVARQAAETEQKRVYEALAQACNPFPALLNLTILSLDLRTRAGCGCRAETR